jgi:hypothetical protein
MAGAAVGVGGIGGPWSGGAACTARGGPACRRLRCNAPAARRRQAGAWRLAGGRAAALGTAAPAMAGCLRNKPRTAPMRWYLVLGMLLPLLSPLAAQAQAPSAPPRRPPPPPAEDLARPGHPGWAVDAATGCWVWNPEPEPGETVRWTGACPRGPASGNGTVEWRYQREGQAQVERYVGPLREGREHGRGVHSWAGGNSYEGDFRDGRQHGRGTFSWSNGERYEGEWRDGRQNGRGLYILDNGNRYEGEFRDDRLHGHGVYIWTNGDRYEGGWRDDRRTGRGVLNRPNGDRYEGEWRDDRPDGRGEMTTLRDGDYRGIWRGGCFTRNDGRIRAINRPLEECR